VGADKAKELIYTGRRISAQEALRIGLVEHVYPTKPQLIAEARNLAQEIADNGSPVIGCTRAINIAMNYPSDVGLLFKFAAQHTYLQGFQQGARHMLKNVKEEK